MKRIPRDRSLSRSLSLIGVVFLLAICLVLAALQSIQASASQWKMKQELTPRVGTRGFIALPSAGTISVQNLTATSVGITVEYYSLAGQKITETTDNISGEAITIFAKPQDFEGFARVNVDDELQVVNYELTEAGNDAYIGSFSINQIFNRNFPDLAFHLPIPYVVKNRDGFSSKFTLQNLGNNRGTLVLSFYQGSETPIFLNYIIQAGEAIAIDLADLSEIPDNFRGSVILTSDQPQGVSGSVRTYNDPVGIRHAYIASPLTDAKLFAPTLFKKYNLQSSKLCVQNFATFSDSITVTYTDNVSATVPSLQPGRLHCFDQANESHADGWAGSGTIVSSSGAQLVAVVIVEAKEGEQLRGSWSYEAIRNSDLASQKVLGFPLLLNDADNWSTVGYLYNPGTTPATVIPRYISRSGVIPCVEDFTIAPGGVHSISPQTLPADFGQGMAYFLADQPLAGAVGATSSRALGDTDRHFGYSGASTTQSVAATQPCNRLADPAAGPIDVEFRNYQRGYFTDIGALDMWARGFTGISTSHPITIAVIDTGVDLDHPDIAANLISGYDYIDDDTTPDDESSDSHGSKVAGIIAARMNNDIVGSQARGIVGIGGGDALAETPGLRILPIRVAQNSSETTCARSAQAIDYATAQGAQIINISYGSTEFCQTELTAIQAAFDAGVAIVAGAGNGNSATPFFPAAYGAGDNENLVIAVAGLLPSGAKADGSNYGSWVDVAAPYRLIRSLTKDGGYASDSGTSFSAPFVSGLLGILMSNFGYSRDQAIGKLRATADNVDSVNADYVGQLGAGRINAGRATDSAFQMYIPNLQR